MSSVSNETNTVKNHFVCYLDILGYSKLITDIHKNPEKSIIIRDKIRDTINNTIHLFVGYKNESNSIIHSTNRSIIDNTTYQVLSDSILIILPADITTKDVPTDDFQSTSLLIFLQIVSMNFLFISSLLGYFLRGSIVFEPHYQVPLNQNDSNNQFIFSKALVTAVELEKKANYPRILIDETILKFINKLEHNIVDYSIRKDFDNQSMLDVYGFLKGTSSNEQKMLKNICTVIKKQVEINMKAPSILQKYYLYSLYHNKCLTEKNYKDKSLFIDIQSIFNV